MATHVANTGSGMYCIGSAGLTTRNEKKKHYSSITDRWHGDELKEILKSPSNGPKNIVNIRIRSCQLISHTQKERHIYENTYTLCVNGQGPKLGPMKNGADYTQTVNKLLIMRQQVGKPNPHTSKQMRFRQRPQGWSQSSSSSSTWWTPQEWQNNY